MKFKPPYLSILFCFLLASCFDGLPEPHDLAYNEEFDALAKDIVTQNEIFAMDDFTRYHKSINDVFVESGNQPETTDTSAVQPSYKVTYKPLPQVLDSLNIRKDLFDDFRQRLEKTKLRQFYKSGDSVLFIVDGFLDDSWGFIYSGKDLVTNADAFSIGGYSVNMLDSINRNWRRVSIH